MQWLTYSPATQLESEVMKVEKSRKSNRNLEHLSNWTKCWCAGCSPLQTQEKEEIKRGFASWESRSLINMYLCLSMPSLHSTAGCSTTVHVNRLQFMGIATFGVSFVTVWFLRHRHLIHDLESCHLLVTGIKISLCRNPAVPTSN